MFNYSFKVSLSAGCVICKFIGILRKDRIILNALLYTSTWISCILCAYDILYFTVFVLFLNILYNLYIIICFLYLCLAFMAVIKHINKLTGLLLLLLLLLL
jgi:hypothetical protein